MKEKTAGKEKSPVLRAGKQVVRLLQNKIIGSLLLMGQGILFLASPSGDVTPTIRLSAGLIILVCLITVFFHMRHREKTRLDKAITVINCIIIAVAVFFLFMPEIIKPYVRIAIGAITIITALVNLFETLKIKNKKDWKFIVSIIGVLAITALGIFTITAPEENIAVLQRGIGTILVLNAVVNIWYVIQFRREARKTQ